MNKSIMCKAGFSKDIEAIYEGKCPCCNKKINEDSFSDSLSIKEYRISGMCQECQDSTFGGSNV